MKENNGIKIAESIIADYPNIKIVFISEDINCVTDIFRITPVYFLLKPYDRRHVRDSLYKITNMINDEQTETIMFGSVTGKDGQTVIKTRNIYYIESEIRVVHIHMFDEFRTYYAKLGEIEPKLKSNFIRCHQSYIVNMDRIKCVRKNMIVMYNGAEIPISRKKYKETIQIINSYLRIE